MVGLSIWVCEGRNQILGDRRIGNEMIFRFQGKDIGGESAVEIVRRLERADKNYPHCGEPIRQYLSWSLNELTGIVPPREVDVSNSLDDETLALGYLLLLEECGVGEIASFTDKPKE